MSRRGFLLVCLGAAAAVVGLVRWLVGSGRPDAVTPAGEGAGAALPVSPGRTTGRAPLEKAVRSRRSVRVYADEPLELDEIAQLLWAAQGVTDVDRGLRAAPSAGATYPLELYVVAERVEGLDRGAYRFRPADQTLEPWPSGTSPPALAEAALSQGFVADAPAVLVVSGVPERTMRRYGDRGRRYVYMEAGHAAQNIYLQATALGLGTVSIGAFDDAAVVRELGLPRGEEPLYLMPVGRSSSMA